MGGTGLPPETTNTSDSQMWSVGSGWARVNSSKSNLMGNGPVKISH